MKNLFCALTFFICYTSFSSPFCFASERSANENSPLPAFSNPQAIILEEEMHQREQAPNISPLRLPPPFQENNSDSPDSVISIFRPAPRARHLERRELLRRRQQSFNLTEALDAPDDPEARQRAMRRIFERHLGSLRNFRS